MSYEASRTKQLLVLQPKGKPLYDDNSSFGLKMLERMGWKKGNGLGRDQQGNLEFIQVRYKNNAVGLGYDRLKDNQWTENESNFNELLQNLNNANNSDESDIKMTKPAKSLEEISKTSRARVHYKKFTKGKDVFKYSEKDLANILGKKSLNPQKATVKEEEIVPEVSSIPESSHIVNTGVTVTDYFKRKLQKVETVNENDEDIDNSEEIAKKKKKKSKKEIKESPKEEESSKKGEENQGYVEEEAPKEIIQVTAQVAKKMSHIQVDNFIQANIGNIIGYGMIENVELKIVKSKMGDNSMNTDKYSIYNTDRVTKTRVNPRKILTKIKKTKKSIQVI